MKIEVVKPFGFCSGVRRAMHLTESALKNYKCVYCYGELIHNEGAVEDLRKKGLFILSSLDDLNSKNDSALIIRTHGTSPEVYNSLKNRNINLIDATCPIVKKIQMLCMKYSSKDYKLLIFGDENHEEVKSLLGFSSGKAVVISDLKNAENFSIDKKTFLISQSTKDENKLFKIRDYLFKRGLPKENFYNTICTDIKSRQKKLSLISRRVDNVLVLGSKKSANTVNLFNIAKERCKSCFLISEFNDIPEDITCAGKIGVATGASTPYNFLDLVLKKIKNSL